MGMEKIRFLYLWISSDHASSRPRMQSRTRRTSEEATRFSSFISLSVAIRGLTCRPSAQTVAGEDITLLRSRVYRDRGLPGGNSPKYPSHRPGYCHSPG